MEDFHDKVKMFVNCLRMFLHSTKFLSVIKAIIFVYIRTYLIYTRVHTYVFVFMHTCIRTYARIYLHTYLHTYVLYIREGAINTIFSKKHY